MDYFIFVLTNALIYGIITLGYAVPVGYTGMVNFGQAGMLAVGAYTAAILGAHGIPAPLAILAAALLTGLAGFLLGLPARRLKSDYYALITLGFIFVMNSVILNWTPLTGGPFGISGIQRPQGFHTSAGFLFLTAVTLLVLGVIVRRLMQSPFGRVLGAIRDDEEVAASLGKRVTRSKLVAMTLSGVVSGIGGAYLAYFIQFINERVFWLDLAVFLLAALVLGGLASFQGSLLGVAVLFVLQEPLRFLPLPGTYLGPLRIMLWSLLLLLCVLFRPRGIAGKAELDN